MDSFQQRLCQHTGLPFEWASPLYLGFKTEAWPNGVLCAVSDRTGIYQQPFATRYTLKNSKSIYLPDEFVARLQAKLPQPPTLIAHLEYNSDHQDNPVMFKLPKHLRIGVEELYANIAISLSATADAKALGSRGSQLATTLSKHGATAAFKQDFVGDMLTGELAFDKGQAQGSFSVGKTLFKHVRLSMNSKQSNRVDCTLTASPHNLHWMDTKRGLEITGTVSGMVSVLFFHDAARKDPASLVGITASELKNIAGKAFKDLGSLKRGLSSVAERVAMKNGKVVDMAKRIAKRAKGLRGMSAYEIEAEEMGLETSAEAGAEVAGSVLVDIILMCCL